MAKPNYQFEKRQRDLAKKNKQEEKRLQKLRGNAAEKSADGVTGGDDSAPEQEVPAEREQQH